MQINPNPIHGSNAAATTAAANRQSASNERRRASVLRRALIPDARRSTWYSKTLYAASTQTNRAAYTITGTDASWVRAIQAVVKGNSDIRNKCRKLIQSNPNDMSPIKRVRW